jgi:hypothetical protein
VGGGGAEHDGAKINELHDETTITKKTKKKLFEKLVKKSRAKKKKKKEKKKKRKKKQFRAPDEHLEGPGREARCVIPFLFLFLFQARGIGGFREADYIFSMVEVEGVATQARTVVGRRDLWKWVHARACFFFVFFVFSFAPYTPGGLTPSCKHTHTHIYMTCTRCEHTYNICIYV